MHPPARPRKGPDADDQGQGLCRNACRLREGRRPATRRLRRSLGLDLAANDLLAHALRHLRRAQEARAGAASGQGAPCVGDGRRGEHCGRTRRAGGQPCRCHPGAHDGRRSEAPRAAARVQALLRRRLPHHPGRGRTRTLPRRRTQLRACDPHERLAARYLRHLQGHAHEHRHVQRRSRPVLCLFLPRRHCCYHHLRSLRRHQDPHHERVRQRLDRVRHRHVVQERGHELDVQGLDARMDPLVAQHDHHLPHARKPQEGSRLPPRHALDAQRFLLSSPRPYHASSPPAHL